MTALDLDRAKNEVIMSLIPLLIFIVFVLYAFCRLGVFSICNPLKSCSCRADEIRAGAGGRTGDITEAAAEDNSLSPLSPQQLLAYKRASSGATEKSIPLIDVNGDNRQMSTVPATIHEDIEDGEGIDHLKTVSHCSSSKSNPKAGEYEDCANTLMGGSGFLIFRGMLMCKM